MIEFRKVDINEKENLLQLMNEVLDNLERKDFFMPFTEEELKDIFNRKFFKTVIKIEKSTYGGCNV